MSLFSVLFIAFLTIPVLEIYFLIQVGTVIGAGYTILLVFGTAVLGAHLLRKQGLSTFTRAQNSLNKNEVPAMEMLEGLILLVTGALLLTPGFFTDIIGFLCLIPMVRQFLIKKSIKKFTVIHTSGTQTQTQTQTESKTIEGEFWKNKEE